MPHSFQRGQIVVAVSQIQEAGFMGHPCYIHAMPGDQGLVVAADAEAVTVKFQRTGTVTDCLFSEVRLVRVSVLPLPGTAVARA